MADTDTDIKLRVSLDKVDKENANHNDAERTEEMDYSERFPDVCELMGNTMRKTCSKKSLQRRVPIFGWLPKHNGMFVVDDLVAGITVGLTVIPQGIAYAVVAGLPPQYGLYSSFMGCFVYIFFGSCKDVTIGPTAITALMIHTAVVNLNIDFAILATFLSGIIIFLSGVLNLGFLVQFISAPIIIGFTNAATIIIASGQMKSLLGIKSGSSNEFLDAWSNVFKHYDEIRYQDTILGIISVILLLGLKKINQVPRWPLFFKYLSISRNAIIVIGGTVAAYVFYANGIEPFRLTGAVTSGLPPFRPPPFETIFQNRTYEFPEMVKALGMSLVTIPLVSIIESIAIAKAFSKGKIIDASQEMIALGMCNIFGAFVSSIPVTGSFTRTAVNNASGVKSPLSGAFTGVIVLLALGLLTSTFYFIPKATLAAVILSAMFSMLEFSEVVEIYRTKRVDIIPFLVTFITSLLFGLEYGILVGTVVNLIFILYNTSRPNIDFKLEKVNEQDLLIVTPDQSLVYSSAEYFKSSVVKMATVQYPSTKLIIIKGDSINSIDSTVMKNLCSIIKDFKIIDKKVYLWNWKKEPFFLVLRYNKEFIGLFKNSETLSDLMAQIKNDDNNVGVTIE